MTTIDERADPRFAVGVTLLVRPDCIPEFLEAIRRNAALSSSTEPGCLRFEVTRSTNEPNRFYFNELYVDEAAFQAHRATAHFAEWREAAAKYVVPDSQVNTYSTSV